MLVMSTKRDTTPRLWTKADLDTGRRAMNAARRMWRTPRPGRDGFRCDGAWALGAWATITTAGGVTITGQAWGPDLLVLDGEFPGTGRWWIDRSYLLGCEIAWQSCMEDAAVQETLDLPDEPEDGAPEIASEDAGDVEDAGDPTVCGRCGRTLTSAESVLRGYGPGCARRIREAATVADAKPEAIAKAQELIEQGAIVPLRGRRVFTVVASNGVDRYLTAAQGCNCPAGLRGVHTCYHRVAVALLAA
jgi:ferredoxin